MFPEEYYELQEYLDHQYQHQMEYEAYVEECRRAESAAEDYYNKHLINADTTRESWINGFVIGWLNKR